MKTEEILSRNKKETGAMNSKEFFYPDEPVHWQVNLYTSLCGAGWIQTAGTVAAVTCPDCITQIQLIVRQFHQTEEA